MSERKKIGAISLPIDRLHIEVTNHCNFSCKFCPDFIMKREKGFMDFEMLKDILDEVSKKKIARLVLFHLMGESLLYPKLLEAVRYATEKGLKTCLTTNGSLLTPKLIDEMIKAGLSRIILSLQTPDKETFKLRGANGFDFDEYKNMIRQISILVLNQRDFNLTISFLSTPFRRLIFPIMPNISIADTSKDLRTYLSHWAEFILKGTACESNLEKIGKSLRFVSRFKNNRIPLSPSLSLETRIMGDWAKDTFRREFLAKIGFCPGIQENFGVLWNGNIVFCCVDYEGKTAGGNFKDISISDYLRSDYVQDVVKGFNKFKVIHPHCRHCLGDNHFLHAVVRQIGSILYFKGIRKIFT